MTTEAEVGGVARKLLRDFGTFFEENFGGSTGSTLRLPQPLVEPDSLSVTDNATGDPITEYVLNARNGLLKLNTPGAYANGVSVNGIFYQWFLDEDLEFYASLVASEHTYHRTGITLREITGVEVEVMGIGTLVMALWALLSELATDIDVSTPEGINIPAHQRYQQVSNLIQYWTKQYEEKAAMLNVGLKKIEQFNLRRQSRLTGRLVPMYRSREVDSTLRPVRVRPPIDPIEPTPFEEEDEYWADRGGEVDPFSSDLGVGGWSGLGTGGG